MLDNISGYSQLVQSNQLQSWYDNNQTGGLSIPKHDYLSINPSAIPTDGTTPQVYLYKLGGASGTTVATVSILYDTSGNIVSLTKTVGTTSTPTPTPTPTPAPTPTPTSLAFLEYTTANVSSFRIKAVNPVNYDVDWGDGSTETGLTNALKDHTYSTAGIYTIKITPAAGTTFRPEHYGSTNYGTNLTKVEGTGGSQLGTDLTKWMRETTSLTSMGSVDTSSVANFQATWRGCTGLTSFPALNFSAATNFNSAWLSCSSLTSYPANVFDTTGTLLSTAFSLAWHSCALTAQSIENILTSLDTNGSSNITLDVSAGTNAAKSTWSTAANTAYNNLITKGWTITYNT